MLGLVGTVLKEQYAWITAHAEKNKAGQLCCKATGQLILARVTHKVRHDDDPSTAPFTTEMRPGGGKQVTFISYCCTACNEPEPLAEEIYQNDLVFLKAEE